jgi:DNA-binding MarR family transcriptional regulator
MIQLMVRNGYLKRKVHKEDKRRSSLQITVKGEDQIDLLMPVIRANRAQALQNISKEEIDQLHSILHKLITNCSTK